MEGTGVEASGPQVLYWVAPMDANYRRDKPGKSPMGMDLVAVYAEDNAEDGVVKISPVVQNNLGVRLDRVKKGQLGREISTVGYIAFDEDKLFHVHTRVDGWVEKLLAKSNGDKVSKNQKLFELYSPDLVNAQEDYLTALKSQNRILISASRDRLSSLGLSNWQIEQLDKTRKVQQRIDYTARFDGFVQNLTIREGMFIKPSMDLLTIAQIDTVWVIAEVFERQSGWVKVGQKVDMTVAAYPEKSWQGLVDYIYPTLDEKTRTLRVR
ncbi:MAG: efflux RND transporter periplasmic adaptor subunit, partial [Gammaproteobacteria bacterium]|nr:efflux RND transporter periplasmic adaptor subunit [Gammaproteobacteria bacterium]